MIDIQQKEDYLFNDALHWQVEFHCFCNDIKDFKIRRNIANLYSQKMTERIKLCKSPIERILYLICLRFPPEVGLENIFLQYKIDKYFADIAIKNTEGKIIIFEADGHDFHEKTKEQAKHDKERDRFLQSLGCKIYRFTGSEIYSNTLDVIIEVSTIIENEFYGDCENE